MFVKTSIGTCSRYLELVHPIWHKAHFKIRWLYAALTFASIFGLLLNVYHIPTTKVNYLFLYKSLVLKTISSSWGIARKNSELEEIRFPYPFQNFVIPFYLHIFSPVIKIKISKSILCISNFLCKSSVLHCWILQDLITQMFQIIFYIPSSTFKVRNYISEEENYVLGIRPLINRSST